MTFAVGASSGNGPMKLLTLQPGYPVTAQTPLYGPIPKISGVLLVDFDTLIAKIVFEHELLAGEVPRTAVALHDAVWPKACADSNIRIPQRKTVQKEFIHSL
jgi:hypothetical protein